MISESKDALKKSIAKYRDTFRLLEAHAGEKLRWSYIHKYIGDKRIPYGASDCPLCQLYINSDCIDCCIYDDTHHKYCRRTPYRKYELALKRSKTVNKNLIKTVKDELAYLEDMYKRVK